MSGSGGGDGGGDGEEWRRVLLLGDSLTQQSFSAAGCWGALLADRLQRRCDVLVRGFSGYNTRWMVGVVREMVAAGRLALPACVAATIFLGANDAAAGDQHVPVPEYKHNLATIISLLAEGGLPADRLILITPPPWDRAAWFATARAAGNPTCERHPERYAAACREIVADTPAIRLVDLYSPMVAGGGDYSAYLSDGLHLSTEGSTLLYDLLVPHVDAALEAAKVPDEIYPNWKDFCEQTDKAKKYME